MPQPSDEYHVSVAVPLHGHDVVVLVVVVLLVVEVVVVVVSVPHRVGASWQSSVPVNGGSAHGQYDGHGFSTRSQSFAAVDHRDKHERSHASVVVVLVVVVVV
jgi:hypothetical protein